MTNDDTPSGPSAPNAFNGLVAKLKNAFKKKGKKGDEKKDENPATATAYGAAAGAAPADSAGESSWPIFIFFLAARPALGLQVSLTRRFLPSCPDHTGLGLQGLDLQGCWRACEGRGRCR